jgi:predicted RNA binding protein YcfA (HicA-like mRNA interferase family)
MSPKLPVVSGRQVVKAMQRIGYGTEETRFFPKKPGFST